MSDQTLLAVTGLGQDGDGRAAGADGPVFIPGGLPGETYRKNGRGGYDLIGVPSAHRVEPPCVHFGVCGGCVAQHVADDLYRAWKLDMVAGAFRGLKLDAELAPLLSVPQRSRRRASLTAHVTKTAVVLGFHARRSHDLVDMTMCTVLDAAIAEALPTLRAFARTYWRDASGGKSSLDLRIDVAALEGGLDVAINGGGHGVSPAAAAHLAEGFRAARMARLTIDGETVAFERQPQLPTRGGNIPMPPAAFFQAAAAAQDILTERVIAGVGKAKRVADLFCGAGTFTLPLAQRARVAAFDSDKPALEALAKAARSAVGLKPIQPLYRNLLSEPLSPLELKEFDAVVLDPPRAGAKAQCESLAKSAVGTIVAVSCNPTTLARDCKVLVDAGFAMGPVHSVDQFVWSEHVEAVVTLTRRR